MPCPHTVTGSRPGKPGIWCLADGCESQVYDVDPRECKDCRHYKRLIDGSICRKHLIAVVPDMHVMFKISEGTCWEAREESA